MVNLPGSPVNKRIRPFPEYDISNFWKVKRGKIYIGKFQMKKYLYGNTTTTVSIECNWLRIILLRDKNIKV